IAQARARRGQCGAERPWHRRARRRGRRAAADADLGGSATWRRDRFLLFGPPDRLRAAQLRAARHPAGAHGTSALLPGGGASARRWTGLRRDGLEPRGPHRRRARPVRTAHALPQRLALTTGRLEMKGLSRIAVALLVSAGSLAATAQENTATGWSWDHYGSLRMQVESVRPDRRAGFGGYTGLRDAYSRFGANLAYRFDGGARAFAQ